MIKYGLVLVEHDVCFWNKDHIHTGITCTTEKPKQKYRKVVILKSYKSGYSCQLKGA